MARTQRLTTRGPRTAQAIRDREPFTTSGALSAQTFSMGAGYLFGDDLDRWNEDAGHLSYVVYSYSTPIAWWVDERGWYKVKAKFSRTTSHHQGNLYLCGD